MLLNRVILPILAISFLAAVPSLPSAAQTPPAYYCGGGYGPGVMGFLTPEQRMMHFAEVQDATAQMSFNDMRDYRLAFRSKVMAMSGAERQRFVDDLAAKWNALPADRKQKIEDEFTAYRGPMGAGMGRGRGMGRGMGPGMGQGMGMGPGGCWW